MAFCTKCGKQLNDGAGFCSGCGAKIEKPAINKSLEAVPQKKVASKTKKGGMAKLIMLLAILALAIIGVIIIKNHRNEDSIDTISEQADDEIPSGKMKKIKVEDCVYFTFTGYDSVGSAEWAFDIDKVKNELSKANKELKDNDDLLDALANKMTLVEQESSQQEHLSNGDDFGVKLTGIDTLEEYGIAPANTEWSVKVEGLEQGEPVDVFDEKYITIEYSGVSPEVTIKMSALEDEKGLGFSYRLYYEDNIDEGRTMLLDMQIGDKFIVRCTTNPEIVLREYGLVIAESQKEYEVTADDVAFCAKKITDIAEDELQDLIDEALEANKRENKPELFEEIGEPEYIGAMLMYSDTAINGFIYNKLYIIMKKDYIGKGKTEVCTRYLLTEETRIDVDKDGHILTRFDINSRLATGTNDEEDGIEIENALIVNPGGFADISKWYDSFMADKKDDPGISFDYTDGAKALLE